MHTLSLPNDGKRFVLHELDSRSYSLADSLFFEDKRTGSRNSSASLERTILQK